MVVFPTPPFWLTTTMTRVPEGRGNVSRETVPLIAPSGASLMRSPLVNATPPTAWNLTGRRLKARPADHRSVPTNNQSRLVHLHISFSLSLLLALSTLVCIAYPTPVATPKIGKASLTYMTPGMDLASAPLGTPLTLIRVDAAKSRQRLATLGLREGASFRLLTRTVGGGRIVLVGGSRIALSKDLVRQMRAQAA